MPTLQAYLNQASVKTNKTERARGWIKKCIQKTGRRDGVALRGEDRPDRNFLGLLSILTVSPEQCHRAISLDKAIRFL